MNKPHIHAAVIKAWADGAEIEFRAFGDGSRGWQPAPFPSWNTKYSYRVKPQPHKWQAVMDAHKAGKVCQWRSTNPYITDFWHTLPPNSSLIGWHQDGNYEYRIKPELVTECGFAQLDAFNTPHIVQSSTPNLKLTFEEGKLTAAEVLK